MYIETHWAIPLIFVYFEAYKFDPNYNNKKINKCTVFIFLNIKKGRGIQSTGIKWVAQGHPLSGFRQIFHCIASTTLLTKVELHFANILFDYRIWALSSLEWKPEPSAIGRVTNFLLFQTTEQERASRWKSRCCFPTLGLNLSPKWDYFGCDLYWVPIQHIQIIYNVFSTVPIY